MKGTERKLVVLGSGGVGKTSLVVQWLEGCFSAAYRPTVEDYYTHTVKMPDGVFHTVEILDTAGSHHFPAMRELSIRSGRGFALVFSLDNPHSFHEAIQLKELIHKIRGDRVPVVLVGNKADLARQVTEEEVKETLEQVPGPYRYIETSAKENMNVGNIFVEILELAEELEAPPPSDQPKRRLSRRLSSLGNIHIRKASLTPPIREEDSRSCTIQ